MARPLIIGCVAAVVAIFAGEASAHRPGFSLQRGETRTFAGAQRGDTVSCGLLHLTVQTTPTYVRIRGVAGKRLMYRQTRNHTLVLTITAPREHFVLASCKRR